MEEQEGGAGAGRSSRRRKEEEEGEEEEQEEEEQQQEQQEQQEEQAEQKEQEEQEEQEEEEEEQQEQQEQQEQETLGRRVSHRGPRTHQSSAAARPLHPRGWGRGGGRWVRGEERHGRKSTRTVAHGGRGRRPVRGGPSRPARRAPRGRVSTRWPGGWPA